MWPPMCQLLPRGSAQRFVAMAYAWLICTRRQSQRRISVTFDSNSWQRVVCPDKFSKDPRHTEFTKLHTAIGARRICPYFVETMVSLEAIRKADRAEYLTGRRPVIRVRETARGRRIYAEVTISADHSAHPGLHPILQDRTAAALALGFRFLKIPRIGSQLPPVALDPANFLQQTPQESAERQQRSFKALRAIEARGVGKTQIEEIGQRISARLQLPGPWWQHLSLGTHQEIREIQKAVAEWADADSVAAHIGYGIEYFCTEDQGKAAGTSILADENRSWLTREYGVRFVTLTELASLV
jgi:hypothetical protein